MKLETDHGPVTVEKRTTKYTDVPLTGWRVLWRGEHFIGYVVPEGGGDRFQAVPTGAGWQPPTGEDRAVEAPYFHRRMDAVRFLAGIGRERERSGTWVES